LAVGQDSLQLASEHLGQGAAAMTLE